VLGIPGQPRAGAHGRAVEALIVFTSPEAQKLYVQNGSRTEPALFGRRRPRGPAPVTDLRGGRRHVLARRASVLAAPASPEISGIIQICGEELHDMLRGLVTPRDALDRPTNRPSSF
jgi:multiple sugar transport system substrate-binding protein